MSIRSDTAALHRLTMESPSGFPAASGSGEPLARPIGGNISNGLAFDIADQLPPAARARLLGWRDDVGDRHAAYRAVSETLDDLRLSVTTARTNQRNRQSYLPQPHTWQADHAETAAAMERALAHDAAVVEQAEDRLKRAQTRADQRAAAWRYSANLVRDAERYLAAHRGAAFADVSTNAPKSLTVEAAVEKLDGLRAELSAVETAPRPSGEARRIIKAQIETLAERGRPNLYPVIEHGEPARLPRTDLRGHDGAYRDGVVDDAIGFIAWAFRDQIMAKLEQELEAASDDGAALGDEERRAKLIDLNTKILAAERQLVAVAERDGVQIPDAEAIDPRALLGIDGPAPR